MLIRWPRVTEPSLTSRDSIVNTLENSTGFNYWSIGDSIHLKLAGYNEGSMVDFDPEDTDFLERITDPDLGCQFEMVHSEYYGRAILEVYVPEAKVEQRWGDEVHFSPFAKERY